MDITEKLKRTRASNIFAEVLKRHVDFHQNDLDLILSKVKFKSIPKGEFFLKAGQSCNFWAFITSGLVRIYSYTPTGEEYTNWFVREEELLTDFISFFDGKTVSLENMVALEDSSIAYIDQEQLQWLMKEVVSFDKFCRSVYQNKLIEMKRHLLYRIRYDAKQRYLYFSENYPELIKRVPLKYIASLLNMTDSSLSRIRRKIFYPGITDDFLP